MTISQLCIMEESVMIITQFIFDLAVTYLYDTCFFAIVDIKMIQSIYS